MGGDRTQARRTVVVVGGGPGGLMAADVLSAAGVAVVVVEHRASVARKFLLAGRSGLNLTHHEPLDDMVRAYDPAARSLIGAALRAFTPDDLRAWAAELGEPTFVGSTGRVFPESFRATPLLRAWLGRLQERGVELLVRTKWLGWDGDPSGHRHRVVTEGQAECTLVADATIFAMGGASWPRVGSDGGWVPAFAGAGIELAPLVASNVGWRIGWTPLFSQRFGGTPLKNIALTVGRSGPVRGDVMVTWTGLEGGPVYTLSAPMRQALAAPTDGAVVTVDLQPDLDRAEVQARLRRRRPKDSLSTALARTVGLTPVAVGLLREVTGNVLPTEPAALARLVKAAPLTVEALMPIDRAISSAGGVRLHEVDDDFMLRRFPGTFAVGEMLDWDAPTGGYLLQATFSTAVVAARATLRWLEREGAAADGKGER